jgi:hypothetical protein
LATGLRKMQVLNFQLGGRVLRKRSFTRGL